MQPLPNPALPDMLALLGQLAPQEDVGVSELGQALRELPAIAADDPDADAPWNHPVQRFSDADVDSIVTFRIDWKDTESCVDYLQALAARWGVALTFGVSNPHDNAFLDTVWVDTLLAQAQQELQPHGLAVWLWDTQGDEYLGWIARRDAEPFFAELAHRWNTTITLADSVPEQDAATLDGGARGLQNSATADTPASTELPGSAVSPDSPRSPAWPVKRLALALAVGSTVILWLIYTALPWLARMPGGSWATLGVSLLVNALAVGLTCLLLVRLLWWRYRCFPGESVSRRVAAGSVLCYLGVLALALPLEMSQSNDGLSLIALAVIGVAVVLLLGMLYVLTYVLWRMAVDFWQARLK